MSTTRVKSKSGKVVVVVDDKVFQQEILRNQEVTRLARAKVESINSKIASASGGRITMTLSETRQTATRSSFTSSSNEGAGYIEAKHGWVIKTLISAGMRLRKK